MNAMTTNTPPVLAVPPVRSRGSYRRSERFSAGIIHAILIIITVAMILPFWLIISVSLTDPEALTVNGYQLIPSKFSLKAYDFIIRAPGELARSYGVTVFVTVAGTSVGLVVMAALAYGMSRLQGTTRKLINGYVLFTVLFSGGVIPFYLIMTRVYQMKDSMMALIFPLLVGPFNVLMLRSYFTQLPQEILEAAKIDGASELRIFFQIAIPLSTPSLATIGLFTALGYWNDYWMALLFISRSNYVPLQYLLFNILNNVEVLSRSPEAAAQTAGIIIPIEPLRMAIAVLAAGPAVIFSMILGKYFTRGITLGAIK